MKTIILAMFISVAASGAPICSMMCNPAKSKPCGGGCISLQKSCQKTWTTACPGIREKTKPKNFTPKHVDAVPQ